jgi:preprotein translocase subunit SecD
MRRGAFLVAIALLAAASSAQAQTPWERLRDSARSWLGVSEDPAAALARLGGTRVLLAPDVDEFRNTILIELRDDVRRLLREARIAHGVLAVREGDVEVELRAPSDLPRAMAALAATAGPAHDAVDITDAGQGLVRLAPSGRAFANRLNGSLDQAVGIIRRRLEGSGVAAAGVHRDDADRIRVIAPGPTDPARMVQLIQSTARLEFRLVDVSMTVDDATRSGAPAGTELVPEARTKKPYLVRREPALDGRDIVDATASFDQNGRPAVGFHFSERGARAFGQLTQENIGRPVAIVFDGEVLTAPVIQTPILGGAGQITGNFTVQQANDLAVLLRAGMLPVKLTVVERTTVEPAAKK